MASSIRPHRADGKRLSRKTREEIFLSWKINGYTLEYYTKKYNVSIKQIRKIINEEMDRCSTEDDFDFRNQYIDIKTMRVIEKKLFEAIEKEIKNPTEYNRKKVNQLKSLYCNR